MLGWKNFHGLSSPGIGLPPNGKNFLKSICFEDSEHWERKSRQFFYISYIWSTRKSLVVVTATAAVVVVFVVPVSFGRSYSTCIAMSAIFDFSSLLTVLLLLICTCAYIREMRPTIFDPAPPAVRPFCCWCCCCCCCCCCCKHNNALQFF